MSSKHRETFSLKGQVGIVTGGAAGLGLGYVKACLDAGATVLIADIDTRTGQDAAERFDDSRQSCSFIPTDVTDPASVSTLFEQAHDRFGKLDFLINNAGAWRFGPASDMSVQDWQLIMDLNLNGSLLCCQAASKIMVPAQNGAIINVSSISGFMINEPHPNWLEPSYFASKAAVIHLTKALAAQWGPSGVRVNCLSPGYMTKEGYSDQMMASPWIKRIPLRRPGLPDELGSAAVFLASPAASYINGTNLIVDGGYSTG